MVSIARLCFRRKFNRIEEEHADIIDIIGNNARTPSRRFFSAEMGAERQPSGRFSLIPIKSNEEII
jgi:hypothetical protein